MRLAGKKLAWDHGLSLPYLTITKIWKKKSPDGRLAIHWQDIEKYMHAVEDASVVLTNSPMGVGEKQCRLNPVERSQSGPISTPVLTQSDSARIETRFSWEFAGQSWCFFWCPSLWGPPLLFDVWLNGHAPLCMPVLNISFPKECTHENWELRWPNPPSLPPCWRFSPFSPNAEPVPRLISMWR